MKPPRPFATLIAALVLCPVAGVAAQGLNPPYLSEFPSVERVMADMKTGDPDETAARRMGTFLQFQKFIKDMADLRFYQHQMTADENNMLVRYQKAYTDIVATNPDYHKFTALHGYDIDPRFQVMLFDKYFSPSFVARYTALDADLKARIAARAKSDTQSMMAARAQDARAQQQAAASGAGGGGGGGGGAEQRLVRRCLEAGRSKTECVANGFGGAVRDLVGGGVVDMMMGHKVTGLRMGGGYPAPARDAVGLTFYPGQVEISCQDLVPDPYDYTVVPEGGQLAIAMATKPAALSFLVRPDGRLQGTGDVSITGRIQVGTQEGTRHFEDGHTEPISYPVFGPATRRCTAGVLATSGPSPKALSMATIGGTAMAVLLGGRDPNAGKTDDPGPRFLGEYGSQGGFDLEFTPEGVVVGCREVAVLRQYTVGSADGRAQLRIQWAPAPLTLGFNPDGSLAGSGLVKVEGRMITNLSSDGNASYAPRSATCNVGALALAGARGGAAGAATAPAAANAVLVVSVNAPAGAGPGAMVLLDDDANTILGGSSFVVPAGTTALSALNACKQMTPNCQKAVLAIGQHTVGIGAMSGPGKGTFNGLVPGSYYLFAGGGPGNAALVWDLKVTLKTGDNGVVLTQGNAAR